MENEKRFEEVKGFVELTQEEKEKVEGGEYNHAYRIAHKTIKIVTDWYDSWN